MKIKFCALFCLFNSCFLLFGQNTQNSQLLNQGQLPEDYTQPSYEKYLQILNENGLSVSHSKNNEDRRQFYLESTYVIDELLRSGSVLYNDPIGDYVNSVLDVVVASNPELKEKSPRVYVFRSTEVNAFAVDQGIIFITLGLLSQLENEAQLALILSHELVHVNENHGLDGFLEDTRLDNSLKKGGRINTTQIDISTLEKNRYSREQEIEADDKGLTYFLNTNYSFATIQRVFDVLRYAYLPYDEIVFEPSILEKISVTIPENYLLEEVQAINPAEEDEEQSTHPALSKRMQQFRQRLGGMDVADEQVYIVSEELFQDVQLKSRSELARLYLKNQQLAEAIYSGFLMGEIYGESSFSREIIGKALYGLTKFKNNKLSRNLASPRSKNVEGESQQVFHIIKKLSKVELNVLAIAYNYDRYIQQPEDEVLRALVVDLFSDMYLFHETESLSFFYVIDTVTIDTAGQGDVALEGSKIDKIRQNQKEKEEGEWHKFAFSEVLGDTTFRNIAQEGFAAGEELREEEDYYDSSEREGRENRDRYNKEVEKNGFSLGIDKVVIINPLFIHLDNGIKNPKLNYIESDERREVLHETIESSAEMMGVDVQILDAKNITGNGAEKLNDIITASEWIENQLDADDFLYQGYNYADFQTFAAKYDTRYVMSIVVVSALQRGALGRLLNRKGGGSFIFVMVCDVIEGRRAFIKSDYLPFYINDAFLKSELYDAFNQLSKTK